MMQAQFFVLSLVLFLIIRNLQKVFMVSLSFSMRINTNVFVELDQITSTAKSQEYQIDIRIMKDSIRNYRDWNAEQE